VENAAMNTPFEDPGRATHQESKGDIHLSTRTPHRTSPGGELTIRSGCAFGQWRPIHEYYH